MSIASMMDPSEEQGNGTTRYVNSVLDLITYLIDESEATYAQTLLASARQENEQAWESFKAGFEIDQDINKLTRFHLLSQLGGDSRHTLVQ